MSQTPPGSPSLSSCSTPSSPSTTIRAAAWAFTYFLGGESKTPDAVRALLTSETAVSYVVCGLETCPTTHRQHLQGYLQRTQCRLSSLRRLLPGAHWEPAKGTPAQNLQYCSKEGDFWSSGTMRASKRGGSEAQISNYQEIISLAKRGLIQEIEEKHPRDFFIRYQTIRTIMKDYQAAPDPSPNVRGVWIRGAAGVGKSRLARAIYAPFYAKMANKWFDGYQGEKYIILDDVGPDQAKTLTYHLKIWTDRYPFVAEIKNGSRMIAPLGFIITSQYEIDHLWSDQETREALHRRCTDINLDGPCPSSTSHHRVFGSSGGGCGSWSQAWSGGGNWGSGGSHNSTDGAQGDPDVSGYVASSSSDEREGEATG